MENRNFNTWLVGFRDSIADYGYYIDFEKVHKNVDNIKVELNILNSLVGSKNIETDFENLMRKYPEVLKCIPLLLAVRGNEIRCQDEKGSQIFRFDYERNPIDLRKLPPNSYAYYRNYKSHLQGYHKEKPPEMDGLNYTLIPRRRAAAWDKARGQSCRTAHFCRSVGASCTRPFR